MDSLFKRRVPDHSQQQLSTLLNCRNKNIKINVLPVQQQTSGVKCGLFALEFCSEILLTNFNQVGIYFQEDKLRPHLLHCLAAEKITEFPKSIKESYKLCGEKLFPIDMFCSCLCHGRRMRKIYMKSRWPNTAAAYNGSTERTRQII